jgi:hypothetical protein
VWKIRPRIGQVKPERKGERVSGMVTTVCNKDQREHIRVRAKETVPQCVVSKRIIPAPLGMLNSL